MSNKDHVKINDLFCPPFGLVPVRLPVELFVPFIMFVLVGLSINQSPLEYKYLYFKMCLLRVIFILLVSISRKSLEPHLKDLNTVERVFIDNIA